MIEFFAQLVALARLPRIALIAVLATGALIFFPPDWLAVVGADRVKTNWRTELGVVFILSAAVLVSSVAFFIFGAVQSWRITKARRSYLHKLTAAEKAVLAPYILGGETTVIFDYGDGVVQGLEARKILYRSANIGALYRFPYNMQLWAREYLEAHEELLDGASALPPEPRRLLPRHW